MGRLLKIIAALTILFCLTVRAQSQEHNPIIHNVLYINSYAMTYTWADSVVAGIQHVFSPREDIQLYIEFLDAKRFKKLKFQDIYRFYKNKYRTIHFDVAIASDNDALDFLIQYGDSLIPDVPVVFCGINNPEHYKFDSSNFYGILDGIDLKSEIDLITKVMPDVKKLYFISDSITTTSLLNLKYIKRIEPEYADRIKFAYICNYSLDSLMQVVGKFEKGSAIALINYTQDKMGNAVNPEAIYLEVTHKSPVPIFMESETLLGKGIAGGIIIKGYTHGRDAANMALKFIENPDYTPLLRITRPENRYYFDYKILRKFGISEALIPAGSVVINKPHAVLVRYLKYISSLLAVIGFLLLIVFILFFNIKRRKKAEEMITQKLAEIQDKNMLLNDAHQQVNDMNTELEEINEHLSKTNEALRIAKEKSEESDKLKSAFLANMSHEIRTPLNAIVGFSSLLNDSLITEADRERYFRYINSSSDMLLRIIDDILDLSKIEAGQLKIYIEPFSVGELLNDLVESFRQSNIDSQVKIRISVLANRDHLMLKSDPVRFRQIISNLLSNALKFTKEGVIEVGYNVDADKTITFYVKDSGIGIEKNDLKNLFNRFWKAEMHGEKFYSGAGLGLAISKRLCEALGGRIWAESEPGIGTTFFVAFHDFYLIKEENIVPQAPLVDLKSYNWEGFTIAVAEDEKDNLYLLTRILKKLNVEVIGFSNGIEIVDFFRKKTNKKVDLILMDIKMPEMDGIMATSLIREINPNIPIIAQTAYAMVEDIEKIKASSFDDYISKPIMPGLLIEKIKKFLFPART
jgi:signal transduction histidine kinase/CheY-like chemotaxis protein